MAKKPDAAKPKPGLVHRIADVIREFSETDAPIHAREKEIQQIRTTRMEHLMNLAKDAKTEAVFLEACEQAESEWKKGQPGFDAKNPKATKLPRSWTVSKAMIKSALSLEGRMWTDKEGNEKPFRISDFSSFNSMRKVMNEIKKSEKGEAPVAVRFQHDLQVRLSDILKRIHTLQEEAGVEKAISFADHIGRELDDLLAKLLPERPVKKKAA